MKRRKKEKQLKISNIISTIILFLSFVTIFLYYFIINEFEDVSADQLIYTINTATGTSKDVLIDGLIYVLFRTFISLLILFIVIKIINKSIKYKVKLKFKIRSKKIMVNLMPISSKMKIIISFLFLILSIYLFLDKLELLDYFDDDNYSSYIEENYIDPKEVEISSPDEKQNLIYIFLESMESSLLSFENGGNFETSIIPNLEELALNNINFSNNEKVGGASVFTGSHWTIAAMVSQTSGIPLKIPMSFSNEYLNYGSFLPGAYSLGDILSDFGYKNYLLLGSDSTFGGRSDYFNYHGNYNIKDYIYAKENNWISKDYSVWWGYEDKKLFEFAKEELEEISKNDEPFNYTILTADTHFVDGYLDESCEAPFDEHYLNSYNCSDQMVYDFISWIKDQDFYENTTIVIAGDHLTMQKNIKEMFDEEKNSRQVYNVFINSKIDTENSKNRAFTTLDLYPTTLAALGFEIEGNRLGLGTNLFSSAKTLTEKQNFDSANNEIQKKSAFYNGFLLQKSEKSWESKKIDLDAGGNTN